MTTPLRNAATAAIIGAALWIAAAMLCVHNFQAAEELFETSIVYGPRVGHHQFFGIPFEYVGGL